MSPKRAPRPGKRWPVPDMSKYPHLALVQFRRSSLHEPIGLREGPDLPPSAVVRRDLERYYASVSDAAMRMLSDTDYAPLSDVLDRLPIGSDVTVLRQIPVMLTGLGHTKLARSLRDASVGDLFAVVDSVEQWRLRNDQIATT